MTVLRRSSACACALVAGFVIAFVPGLEAPVGAAARVVVSNAGGDAVIDPTYATTLTLRGSGFQSIKGGYGGIYVQFGVVQGSWRPSKGGRSGVDYLTIPDSQTKDNAGYARFIAFPGSDTAGSANGGPISARGSWSTRITVPGATFTTLDAGRKAVTVDCRTQVCGIITVGAHGVSNGRNETFTRVRVGAVAGVQQTGGSEPKSGSMTSGTTNTSAPAREPGISAPATAPVAASAIVSAPALEVDRASARPGRVLSFQAVGLTPGSQVSATFEDGATAVGPLTVAANGEAAGVLRLPTGLRAGTYELRIVGGENPPSVRFAVVADPASQVPDDEGPWPLLFLVGGAVTLAAAVAVLGQRIRRRRA